MRAPGARELLVVAGEGSGDALAAPVVRELGARAFGLGGPALAAAGAELLGNLESWAAMGFGPVARRAPRLATATARLLGAAMKRRPRAALLVGFSELNARIAPFLRRRGARVLWYAPPQVWAWRPRRAGTLARACDHLAVLLPFEAEVWRRAGGSVTYVGHPAGAYPRTSGDRGTARLALLPGSRSHEVRAHLPVLLDAAERLGLPATVLRAPALDRRTARWLDDAARAHGVAVETRPLPVALPEASVAVAASGTATLECAALGVPPVIVYRTGAVTYAVARRLVRVPHIGLPNLVLGRRAFPELVQGEVTAPRVAEEVRRLAGSTEALAACSELRDHLVRDLDDGAPALRVARILEPWLA